MEIESLYLRGLNHFLSSNINEVTYTPKSAFQIIIGSNGSGKTSLIRELSPLPGKPQYYAKGGRKEFICRKDGNRFRLVSDFTNSSEHFFYINDGPNLNEGKKITVQRQLVAEYFNGYDEALHDLLIDQEHTLFTNMSVNDRRKWFTRLNTSDMTFALKFYAEARSKLRDASGALQHLKKRLNEEQNNLNSLESIDGLDQMISSIKKEIIVLLEHKDISNTTSSLNSLNRLKGDLSHSQERIRDLKKLNLKSLRTVIDKYKVDSPESLMKVKEKVKISINVNEGNIKVLLKELEGMGRNLASVNEAKKGEIEKLKEKERLLLKWIQEAESNLKRFPFIENAKDFYQRSTKTVIPTLVNIVNDFSVEEDDDFSREGIIEIREQLTLLTENINTCNTSLNTLRLRKRHIEETCEVDCPSCETRFKPGIQRNEFEKINESISIQETRLEELNDRFKGLNYLNERAEAFLTNWRVFKLLKESNEDHQLLWNAVNSLQVKIHQKVVVHPIINEWVDDLYTSTVICNHKDELINLRKILENEGQGNELYDELLAKRAEEIEIEIQFLQDKVREEGKALQEIEQALTTNERMKGLEKVFRDSFSKLESNYSHYSTSLANEFINEQLITLNSKLFEMENKLTEKEKIINSINLISKDLSNLEESYLGLKTIVNELSPTDGLIADYLSDNIGRVTETINLTLDEMWSYNFKVFPCGVESGDLNYLFPFLIKDLVTPIPDVKEGSRAQKEAVNFSFKLAVMWFLGLENYPLFLDEFSASFDYQHRNNALNYIKNLVFNEEVKQVFYISQYASTHDAFINADICVTDPDNVLVPTNYNQVISFR